MPDTLACYKILDIEPGSSAESVRKAYIALARTWDPERYVNNPVLRAQAEKKRKEIDEAYNAIRFFLPELQDPDIESKKMRRPHRDFQELATGTQPLSTKTVISVLFVVIIAIVSYSAYYLYQKGLRFTPSPTPAPSVSLEQ